MVFSSYPALISDVSIILGISDHNAVPFSFNIEGIINNNPRHYIYLYQKADLDGVSNCMKNFLDTFISTYPYKNSIEQNWRQLSKFNSTKQLTIHEALEKYVSKHQIKASRHILWITHAIKLKMKERKQLYDRAMKTQKHESWEAYCIMRNQITQLKHIRTIKSKFLKITPGTVSKRFWKCIKSLREKIMLEFLPRQQMGSQQVKVKIKLIF